MIIRKAACIPIVLSLLLIFSGCARQQADSATNASSGANTAVNKIEPENTGTGTAAPDVKSTEAKKVVTDLLNAWPSNNFTALNKFCTERFSYKGGPIARIDSVKIIKIDDDVNEKAKWNYLLGRGSITSPYDTICFSVTYDIQYNKEDEKMAIEPSGVKTKWFTVVKIKKDSPWQIDEVGY